MVTALMTARLRDTDEALSRKLNAANVQVGLGSGGSGSPAAASTSPSAGSSASSGRLGRWSAGPDPAPVPAGSALAPVRAGTPCWAAPASSCRPTPTCSRLPRVAGR